MDKAPKKEYMHIRIDGDFKKAIAEKAKESGLNTSVLVNVLLHKWYHEKTRQEK